MNRLTRIVLPVIVVMTVLVTLSGWGQESVRPAKVPKFTGLSVADAKAAAVKAGFVPKFELGEPSKSPEQALTIYAQSPEAGAELARGEVVKLTIYAKGRGSAKPPEGPLDSRTVGPQLDGKVKVPSLIGQSSKEVATALRGMGLVPKFQLGKEPPTDKQQLTVYEQQPKSGVAVARGSEVRVTIHARRADTAATENKNADGPRAVKKPLTELTLVSATPFLDLSEEQIEPRSGELLFSATDLVVQAGPVRLEVRRSFQNLPRRPGLLGTRWQLNWESRLFQKGNRAAIEQASQVLTFSLDAKSKQFRSPAGDSLTVGKEAVVWTKPDGSREVFDQQGRLIEQDRRNGNTVTLRYDTLGRLARVEGPFKSFLNFVTDDEGRLTRIESSTGAIVRYDYEPPAVAKPKTQDESAVRYAYDPAGLLAQIDHPRFGSTQFTYDKKLRVTGHRWADGTSDRIEHDDAARTRRHFDAAGNVSTMLSSANSRRLELTNPLGHKLITENDAAGRPIVVTGPTGMKARLEYDSLGRTVRVENPATGITQFEYAGESKSPTALIAPDGNRQSFEYDEQLNLLRLTNSQHKHLDAAFKYGPNGLVQSVELGNGQRSVFTYDAAGRRESVTDADGKTWRTEYDERGNVLRSHDPLGGVIARTYDKQDRLTSITDAAGGITRFEYAQQGGLFQISITDPRGGVTRNAYDQRNRLVTTTAPGNRTSRFNYDAAGNLTSRTDPAGRTYQFERDAAGNLLREINPVGGITTRTYNAQGNITSVIDPTGATTRLEYSPTGFLSRQFDSTGLPTQFQYDAQGRLLSAIDDAQRATQYEYAAGRVAKVVPPSGRTVELKYDDRGNLASTQRGEKDVVTNEYDVLGRRTKETHSSGLAITFRYDALGKLIAWEDNQGGRETIEYDRAGRMVGSQDANGAKIRLKYDADGNLLETTDPLGQVQRRAYNASGELSEVVEPNGDKAKYEYDSVGRLTTAHHPGGGKSSYAYDPLGQPTRIRNPLGKETRSTYDVAGRMISTTDANGQTTTFTYDVAGRMTEKRYADGKAIKYQYDARGHLSEVDDGAFPVRYEHDLDGRVTRIEYPAIKRSLSYEYNEAGLKTKFVDSEGRTIAYEYDDQDRLIAMRVGDNQPIRMAYDAKDRLTSRVYPNGVQGTWQYYGDDRLLKLTYTDAAGKTLAGWTYQYDAAGNRVQTTEADGRIIRHRYDPAGQLLEEVTGDKDAVKYSYLAGGNRGTRVQSGKTISYRYDEADQLLSAGDETFTHDANGNLIERKSPKGTTRYTWDAENRLVKVVLPDGKEVSYGYAPTGERIWRRDAQGMTHFVTDGENLLAELDGDLKPSATYLHGEAIDQPLLMTRGDKTSFFHADALGSIRRLTDSQGGVRASYDHDAFGQVKAGAEVTDHAFRFTGREFDAATGLYYYRARYYDPRTGRFLSADPVAPSLRQALTLNPYQYALNNPTRYVDPMGTDEVLQKNLANAREVSAYNGPQRAIAYIDEQIIANAHRAGVQGDQTPFSREVFGSPEELRARNMELHRAKQPYVEQVAAQAQAAKDAKWANHNRASSFAQPEVPSATAPAESAPVGRGSNTAAVRAPRAGGNTLQVSQPEPVAPSAVPVGQTPSIRSQVAGGAAAGGVAVGVVVDPAIRVINGESIGTVAVDMAKGTATGVVIAGGVGIVTGTVGAIAGGMAGSALGPLGTAAGILAGFGEGFKVGFGGAAAVGTVIGTVKTGQRIAELGKQLGEGAADAPTAELGKRAGGRIEIPNSQLPIDDYTLGPLLTSDELAAATAPKSKGDLSDDDRNRAKKGLAEASTKGRAVDIDQKLTARERAAAEAASGRGLPGGGDDGPTAEEIGRGIGTLIDAFGGGNTPHRGGQMGNHPRRR